MKYTYISNRDDFLSYISDIESDRVTVIALDLEGEYNLHIYGEQLCLIQVYDGTNINIVDPFKIDKNTLKKLFENRNILKIMYDSLQDSSLLKNNYEIEIKSILDLRPAVELLNYAKKDLHSIINLELGLSLEKKKKYQKYNWTIRPIKRKALEYASNDVLYLFELKDILLNKLHEKELIVEYILRNINIQNKNNTKKPKDRYKNIKGYNSLQDDQKAIIEKVFDIRDKYAKLLNVPPHNVINKDDLLKITKDVQYIADLEFSRKVSPDLVKTITSDLRNTFTEIEWNEREDINNDRQNEELQHS